MATFVTGCITVVAPELVFQYVQYSLGDQFFDELTDQHLLRRPRPRAAYMRKAGTGGFGS